MKPHRQNKKGISKTRLTGDIVRFGGAIWMREAEDREAWSVRRKRFIEQ